MGKIGVFVIDNNVLFRQGLHQALSQTEDIEVVAECSLDDEASELVASFSPEIVLLNIGLPLLNGLDLGRQITQRSPAVSVIILTPYDDDEQLFQAVKSGAVGYLTNEVGISQLVSAIRKVHQGKRPINDMVLSRPKVAEKVLKQFQDLSLMGTAMESLATPLTARELEVLSYVARGYINKQVAHKLSINEQTIKNHMTSILRKLDANDRTQAVVMAIHYGWIPARIAKPMEPDVDEETEVTPSASERIV